MHRLHHDNRLTIDPQTLFTMRSSFALLAMAVSAVSAQSVKDYKSSLDMTIDPNTVDLATRSSWCGDSRTPVMLFARTIPTKINVPRTISSGNALAPLTARPPVSSTTPRPCLPSFARSSSASAFRRTLAANLVRGNALPRSTTNAPSRTPLRTWSATTTTILPAPLATLLLHLPLVPHRQLLALPSP
uniref:Uncharacterized protein n=1 Tax=Fusarium oxysporum (strain Fo5176) TaxID=660025 RepID=A0A0D2X8K3_FUSOF